MAQGDEGVKMIQALPFCPRQLTRPSSFRQRFYQRKAMAMTIITRCVAHSGLAFLVSAAAPCQRLGQVESMLPTSSMPEELRVLQGANVGVRNLQEARSCEASARPCNGFDIEFFATSAARMPVKQHSFLSLPLLAMTVAPAWARPFAMAS